MVTALMLAAMLSQNPLLSPRTFPIAVWLQDPEMAPRYRAAGINLYIGLWEGPTEDQLSRLTRHGMPVICEQNAVGLKHRSNPIIAGWMHQDEPDNAQAIKDEKGKAGWGPCVPPSKIVSTYQAMKAADPSRPVLLNLGQGVANDAWIGRGNGSSLSDYETYVKGGDIVSFDVYPVAGLADPSKINLISKGMDRLTRWTSGKKLLWNCLECTAISGESKPTPRQVKAEAWSAIIHGSRGLIYFVHQFAPKFNEHALLDDREMLSAVTALNAQIQLMAPVLLDPKSTSVHVRARHAGVQAALFRSAKTDYVIAVSLSAEKTTTDLNIDHSYSSAEVLGESRRISVKSKSIEDTFEPYELHIYRLSSRLED